MTAATSMSRLLTLGRAYLDSAPGTPTSVGRNLSNHAPGRLKSAFRFFAGSISGAVSRCAPLGLTVMALAARLVATEGQRQPDIVVYLADDLSAADLPLYGESTIAAGAVSLPPQLLDTAHLGAT